MKKYILVFNVLLLFGCTSKNEKNDTQQTPEALQDNKEAKLISYTKRGADDLVDELYKEAIKNSPGFAVLEKSISELNEKKNDSLRVFENYQDKNEGYYSSATRHINSIQDSLLKREINAVFEKDKSGYTAIISRLNELEERLNKQSIYSADHLIALKLFVTLGMMNQFRKNSTPPASSLGSVLNEYKTLNQKLDSAIVKNK